MTKGMPSGITSAPTDLRHIVLSYLCDNCYADTARVFARDSAMRELDKDGDEVLATGENSVLDAQFVCKVQSRKEIKTQILSGAINEAIAMLTLHFPTVLAPADKVHDTPRYDPAHLFLNLRIQNFIEQSRTIPLPWPSGPSSVSSPSTEHSSPATRFSLLADTFSFPSAEDEARKNHLLCLMHELYVLTHELTSPMDRATYLTELSTVGGLLVYPIPEKSKEMRKLLDMERREAVAEQINEALLYRCEMSLPSVVELSTRHTTLLFATLSSLGRRLPSSEARPAGVEALLTRSAPSMYDSKGSRAAKEKDAPEPFPIFDLKNFLGSRAM